MAAGRGILAQVAPCSTALDPSKPCNPAKPTQNACIESFNGKFRDECLNGNWFTSLEHAKAVISAWRRDYNQVRPHSALGNLTPAAFAATVREQGFAKPTPSDKLANQDSTK